jgi:2-desacetyl-2-hydroxyethyl bacteriochlorophyllide A dehydrogenase
LCRREAAEWGPNMKALMYDAKETLSVENIPEPIAGSGYAKLKVIYGGLCGSDIHMAEGALRRVVKPVVPCHEFIGNIVEIIEKTGGDSGFKVGDRVTAEPLISCGVCEACKKGNYHVCRSLGLYGTDKNGGFAEYVIVPIDKLLHIPENISDEKAALVEPTACAVHMVNRVGVNVGDSVLILGAGPIGMLLAMVTRLAGATTIVLSDINEFRMNMAKELGFEVIDARTAKRADYLMPVGAEGYDICMEVASTKATLFNALELAKVRGKVLAAGVFSFDPEIPFREMIYKELTIIGSRVYRIWDFKTALELLSREDFNAEILVSRITDIDHLIEDGFRAATGGENIMKVLCDPSK